MARRKQTQGACAYCGRALTRGGMARHLGGCEKRQEAIAAAGRKTCEEMPLLHLQVQSAWGGEHWLHLEVNGSATLKQLDGYLRAIWLECCGHLSEFTSSGSRGERVGMSRKVAQAFRPGVELTHVYDFGTSSVTLLKAVAAREGKATTRHPIALMARNEIPFYPCQECGAAATHLCVECGYEEQPGTLCRAHARVHPHEEYGEPMLLVNSPRTGMCGYDGPAKPPY